MNIKVALCFTFLVISGCIAGGGGSQNTTPNIVELKSGYEVTMELSVWGSKPIHLETRYTGIILDYSVTGKSISGSVIPKTIEMNGEKLIVKSAIPALDGVKSGDNFSCVYRYKFDGHDNSTPITFSVK